MTYFAIALKICLIGMIVFVFARLKSVVQGEPLLKLNMKLWLTHVVILLCYYSMWASYEVTYTLWLLDPNAEEEISDTKLKVLASVELMYNVISVFLSCLLFRMVDHITRPVEECYFDPNL